MNKTYREKLAELEDDLKAHYEVEPSFNVTSDGHIEAYDELMGVLGFERVDEDITSIKPKQYQIGIDTFDRLKANATREEAIGFCKYNIDKYAHRNKGCDKEDIGKIKDYCDLWLWVLENK